MTDGITLSPTMRQRWGGSLGAGVSCFVSGALSLARLLAQTTAVLPGTTTIPYGYLRTYGVHFSTHPHTHAHALSRDGCGVGCRQPLPNNRHACFSRPKRGGPSASLPCHIDAYIRGSTYPLGVSVPTPISTLLHRLYQGILTRLFAIPARQVRFLQRLLEPN